MRHHRNWNWLRGKSHVSHILLSPGTVLNAGNSERLTPHYWSCCFSLFFSFSIYFCFWFLKKIDLVYLIILWGCHHPETKTRQRQLKKENYRPISLMNTMKKSSKKFKQTEFNNTLKNSYTMIKLGLFQGCKYSSIYTNQSMWYTVITSWRIKAIRQSQ